MFISHEYIPNWDKKDTNVYPTGKHLPPDDIGSIHCSVGTRLQVAV